jgi:pimeloyl-ACP methyl ester carboxylesterase
MVSSYSLNEDCDKTILFIHSLFSSGYEWSSTMIALEKLHRFHFLYPSLKPNEIYDPEVGVQFLANLIQKEAKNSKAHVVGLSIGSHLAVRLANKHPCLVLTLNVSGYVTVSRILRPLLPIGIYLVKKICTADTIEPSFSMSQSRAAANTLSPSVASFEIRTIIIVGLRPQLIFRFPYDNPKASKELKKNLGYHDIWFKGGKDMAHQWNFSHPERYASVIWARIENKWTADLEKVLLDIE